MNAKKEPPPFLIKWNQELMVVEENVNARILLNRRIPEPLVVVHVCLFICS